MNVNPGELNKRIQIIRQEGKRDNSGFLEKKTDKIIHKAWAKVTRTSIKEVMSQGSEINITKCRFLIRFTGKTINRGMFVLYSGIYYQIEYVNNYGDSNEYLEIMTTAGV